MKLRPFVLLALAACGLPAPVLSAPPNILWFIVDDMSPHFSCYGETTIQTPHVDKLAAEGTRFTRAYVTAPVCSACRSALITGMYQTSIGAHHHRSGRGRLKIRLPEGVQPVPALFRKAGYYTCIGSGLPDKDFRGLPYGSGKGAPGAGKVRGRLGKTDYNFEWDAAIYDSHDWAGRAAEQPFFMQVDLHGGKLREGTTEGSAAFRRRVVAEFGAATDPVRVTLPPYYPRDPVLLEDWAAYLDAVRLTDAHVGEVLARLEAEGLLGNTLVVFMTDHGISHARGKQFLYDEGTHIPFIVRGPGIAKGTTRTDLVEHIDLAAFSLAAAGIPIPASMQGRDLFARGHSPREAAFAARPCSPTPTRTARPSCGPSAPPMRRGNFLPLPKPCSSARPARPRNSTTTRTTAGRSPTLPPIPASVPNSKGTAPSWTSGCATRGTADPNRTPCMTATWPSISSDRTPR